MRKIECRRFISRPLRRAMAGYEQMFRSNAMPAKKLAAQFKADEGAHTVPIQSIRDIDFIMYAIGHRIHQGREPGKRLFLHTLSAARQMNQTNVNLPREPSLPASVYL